MCILILQFKTFVDQVKCVDVLPSTSRSPDDVDMAGDAAVDLSTDKLEKLALEVCNSARNCYFSCNDCSCITHIHLLSVNNP